jgi:co-chaperonin GroES (HSP10)
MNFEPLNRHLLLSKLKEEEEEKKSTILVPDDYSVVKSRHETYGVVAVARDCEKVPRDYVGQKVLVNNAMVEEVNIKGKTYYLMLENHVYGILSES